MVPTRSRAANVQAHNKAINAVRCIRIILPILGLSGVGGADIFGIRERPLLRRRRFSAVIRDKAILLGDLR
jgi:hypothetical protein